MAELATIAQAVAVFSACWAVISGIGAWKREFLGKRQIELAESVLAKFFEIKDAVVFMRNPFSHTGEGSTRQRGEHEGPEQAALLDRGYIVVERYSKKEAVFQEFATMKYRFMASFGKEHEAIFTDTYKLVNSIFVSARMLAHHHWQRQGRVEMEPEEFKKHLAEMHRHEGIFWDIGSEDDEVRGQLAAIQSRLEAAVAPCFQDPARTFTRRWF
jgi:hypothetical protein